MSSPVFTAIIPLYNKEGIIGITLQSILNQKRLPDNLIIVDDGSFDNSLDEVYKREHIFTQLGVNLKLIKQKNAGVSNARNRAIREAPTGSLLCFLDADDYWESDYLYQIEMAIVLYPSYKIFCCGYKVKFSDGKKINKIIDGVGLLSIINYNDMKSVGEFPYFPSSFCAYRETFIDNDIFFPENQKIGEDLSCFFELNIMYNSVFINKPLVTYNIGTPGNTASSNKPMDFPEIIRSLKGKNEFRSVLLQEKDKRYHDYLLFFYLKSCLKTGNISEIKEWCFSWKNKTLNNFVKGLLFFNLAILGKGVCSCTSILLKNSKLCLKKILSFL